jgi:hypothetical protein
VPVVSDSGPSDGGSDLRRDDEGCDEPAYDKKRARRAVIDTMGGGAFVDEPGGIW